MESTWTCVLREPFTRYWRYVSTILFCIKYYITCITGHDWSSSFVFIYTWNYIYTLFFRMASLPEPNRWKGSTVLWYCYNSTHSGWNLCYNVQVLLRSEGTLRRVQKKQKNKNGHTGHCSLECSSSGKSLRQETKRLRDSSSHVRDCSEPWTQNNNR